MDANPGLPMTTSNRTDGQRTRSLNTQTALMEAAEKLVAKKGIENVSIKDIVRESGQKTNQLSSITLRT